MREHGGVVEEYKGKRLVKASDVDANRSTDVTVDTPDPGAATRSHTIMLAFLEPGLVAIGSEQAIKSSIDAQLSAHSITSNNEMMELISDIDAGNNAWAVGRFDASPRTRTFPAKSRPSFRRSRPSRR